MNHLTRLTELSRQSEELVREFGLSPAQDYARKKGQTPEGNMRRAVGVGLLAPYGSGVLGLPAMIQNAADSRGENQIYRKRDAMKDTYGQGLAATAGAGIGAGLGLGAARGYHSALARRGVLVSDAVKASHRGEAGTVGAAAGLIGGAVLGYKHSRNSNARRIAANKEFGLFVKNEPKYGEEGQFEGMQHKANIPGIVGTGLVAAGGVAAGRGISNYVNATHGGNYGAALGGLKDKAGEFVNTDHLKAGLSEIGAAAKQKMAPVGAAFGNAATAAKSGIAKGAVKAGQFVPKSGLGKGIRNVLAGLARI